MMENQDQPLPGGNRASITISDIARPRSIPFISGDISRMEKAIFKRLH